MSCPEAGHQKHGMRDRIVRTTPGDWCAHERMRRLRKDVRPLLRGLLDDRSLGDDSQRGCGGARTGYDYRANPSLDHDCKQSGQWRIGGRTDKPIALGLAMLDRAKRASHIDPPASSYAIMRRARPLPRREPCTRRSPLCFASRMPQVLSADHFATRVSSTLAAS